MHLNEARPRLAAKPRYAKGVLIVARERRRDTLMTTGAIMAALSLVGIPALMGIMQGALA